MRLLATTLLAVSCLVVASGSGARTGGFGSTCVFESGTLTVTLEGERGSVQIGVREGVLRLSGCSLHQGIERIVISGGPKGQLVMIELPPGNFVVPELTVDLGAGTDTVALFGRPTSDHVTLTASQILASGLELSHQGIEFVFFTNNPALSGGGADVIDAREFQGWLSFYDHEDAANRDTVYAGPGGSSLGPSAGDDLFIGGSGRDGLQGGPGADRLLGGAGNDWIDGGPGNDRLEGQEGNDKLEGSTGRDVLLGGAGNDRLDGGNGFDRCEDRRDALRNCERP